MARASVAHDHATWFSYIAPGFDGVGQYGNVFTLSSQDSNSHTPADPDTVLSEHFEIRAFSVSGDSALAVVRHKEVMHLAGHELNGLNLGAKSEHDVRIDEVMRQIWVRIGSVWKLKHWDDLSGRICVDGKLLERWSMNRLAQAPDSIRTPSP